MVEYSLIYQNEVWNSEIVKKTNFNPYQIYQWGTYKEKSGWKILPVKANNNGNIAYLQITYKLKFNIFLGWCIGSISGNVSLFSKDDFFDYLKKELGVKYIFIKSSFTNILNFEESLSLFNSGWNKSIKKINSDYSIFVDLELSVDELLTNCSKNFRKNVKRGNEKNSDIRISFLSEYDTKEIFDLFSRFQQIKDLPLPNINELEIIKENLSDNIVIAVSYIAGKIVGLRAFLFLGNKALDFWAATDSVGRKNYTSNVLLFKLFEKAKELGISEYDMSGIDPKSNPNVFGFKNGLRAQVVEKLGEWEMSNSNFLSFFINKVYL